MLLALSSPRRQRLVPPAAQTTFHSCFQNENWTCRGEGIDKVRLAVLFVNTDFIILCQVYDYVLLSRGLVKYTMIRQSCVWFPISLLLYLARQQSNNFLGLGFSCPEVCIVLSVAKSPPARYYEHRYNTTGAAPTTRVQPVLCGFERDRTRYWTDSHSAGLDCPGLSQYTGLSLLNIILMTDHWLYNLPAILHAFSVWSKWDIQPLICFSCEESYHP